MAYNSQDTYDTEADTIILLQRPFLSSSVFSNNGAKRKSHFTVNGHDDDDDDYKAYSSRACCRHQERQLATPDRFSFRGGCAEWIQDFEEITCAKNWSSKAKPDIVPIYLGDKSTKTWFRENQHEWDDFDSFKLAFLFDTEKILQSRWRILRFEGNAG